MYLEHISRRDFGRTTLGGISLYVASHIPGCQEPDSRTDEYWKTMRERAENMVLGSSPESLVDKKILELTDFLGDTLDPRFINKKGLFKGTYRMGFLEMSDIDRQSVREFDFYITEKFLTIAFMNQKIAKHFDLVERFLLENVVGELKFETGSGYIDSETAKKLGKVYGIDVIGQGIVTLGPTSVDINARIVDTERGRIISTGAVKIENNTATQQWLQRNMETRWKRGPREKSW